MARLHRCAWGQLTDQQPVGGHLCLELPVMAGIDPLQGRAQHRHGPPTPGQAALMHSPINAFGQATHHRPAGLGQGRPDRLRHADPMA
jgi:hypothetical protein